MPVVNQNDDASSFYIIKKGTAVITVNGKEINKIKEGDSFGENALLQGDTTRSSSVVAQEELRCLALGRD